MHYQNGEGPDHRSGGVEARELEQLGRRLEVLPTAEKSLRQVRVIRAEIVGAVASQNWAEVEKLFRGHGGGEL